MRVCLFLDSEAATRTVARWLGECAARGDVFALVGDLGAGKTTFVQGLAEGMGVEESTAVVSPSFTIVNEYPGRLPLYHIDLYRLGSAEECWDLGLEEYLWGDGVCAVEWFDRFPGLWPERTLEIRLEFVADRPEARRLVAMARSDAARGRLEAWSNRIRGSQAWVTDC